MATSFDEIYKKFDNRTTDSNVSSLDNLYYYQRFESLTYAISEFSERCYNDLTDRTNFTQEIYNFTGDNIEVNFTLTEAPDNPSLYVTLDDVETTAYSYNNTTKVLTFNTAPGDGVAIYVGAYIIGEFADTLTDAEISILADGMKVIFISQNLNQTKQLDQMIYGNSIGIYSQANHNKALLNIDDTLYRRWNQRMIEYSFNNDPDVLDALVGNSS